MQGQAHQRIQRLKLQRRLRSNMTDAERKLWQYLRGRQLDGHKFRRQHPYGNFILDFVCLETKLVVEVDGGQHAGSVSDQARDDFLQSAGFKVLRFWNHDVLARGETVVEVICGALSSQPPTHPQPSP